MASPLKINTIKMFCPLKFLLSVWPIVVNFWRNEYSLNSSTMWFLAIWKNFLNCCIPRCCGRISHNIFFWKNTLVFKLTVLMWLFNSFKSLARTRRPISVFSGGTNTATSIKTATRSQYAHFRAPMCNLQEKFFPITDICEGIMLIIKILPDE